MASLRAGYSRDTIAVNFQTLYREPGARRNDSIYRAHKAARDCYWKKNPNGYLPIWIYPDRIHGRNPPGGRPAPVKRNPARRLDAFDVAGASKLYRRFVGAEANTSAKMRKPFVPDALACIGQVTVIQYIAERDGQVHEYRHPFRARSRPHLCVSPDGKLVLMLGGAFTFTEDGFVDE